MDKFSKLRFHEFAKVAAAATVSGVLALHPGPAGAATGSVQVTAGPAKWFVNTNITFSTTSSAWGFSEASLQTASGTRGDAVDGALSWHVNPAGYDYGGSLSSNEYRSPGGVVDISPSPINPSVPTTVTGTTQSLQGLNVSGQMYFMTSKAVVRSILNLQNPTNAPITVSVLSASNLGSDANTTVQATSSGDNLFDAADNWFVSSQHAVPTTADDPILTYAFQGPNAAVRGTNIGTFQNGNDNFNEAYTVTVPANGTASLMMFVQMSDTVANAQTDTAAFDSLSALNSGGYLAGLTQAQLAQIVNWSFVPQPPTLAWSAPASITYGTALGATQLDATATYNSSPVAGVFTYTPPAGTILNAGPNQTLSATFVPTDTANYGTPSSPVTTTITVLQASTTTTAVTPASASVGSPVNVSANVAVLPPGAGTPTGTVTVNDTTDGLSCSYSLGAVTPGCTITPPSAGPKSLTVSYSGDTNFAGSRSNGSLSVSAAVSGTALTSSINPSTFGQAVAFTATITPAAGAPTPTGTVNFNDGVSVLCANVALSSGTASCVAANLSSGSHSIQASYGGDANTSASSSTLTQVVNAATTAMSLTAAPSTVLSGQSVLLTATVTANAPAPASVGGLKAGGAAAPASAASAGGSKGASSSAAAVPSGTVTFLDGANTLGSSPLDASGVATLSVSTLSVGAHTLSASYAGDGSFASATAAAAVTVNPSSPPVPAPTLSTWMLSLLGLGLFGLGARRARMFGLKR